MSRNVCSSVLDEKDNLWMDKWIFYCANVPLFAAFSVREVLTRYQIPLLEHPPYWQDLCIFFVHKSEQFVKGISFWICRKHTEKAFRKMMFSSVSRHSREVWDEVTRWPHLVTVGEKIKYFTETVWLLCQITAFLIQIVRTSEYTMYFTNLLSVWLL